MKHPRTSRLIALFAAFVLALQGAFPAIALAEQRTVEVENHAPANEQDTVVGGIVIDGVDRPTPGSALDERASVTTADGDAWEIPVIWVRDDLQVGNNTAVEGHAYVPVLAFFTPQGYALEGDVTTIALSDSLTALFGTNEIISVYNASTGITYILPASLRNLFASAPGRDEDASAGNTSAPALEHDDAQAEVAAAEASSDLSSSRNSDLDPSPVPEPDYGPGVANERSLVEIHCA